MTININNLNNQPQVNQHKQTQVSQQKANADTQVKPPAADSVSITPQAQQLNKLQKKANDAPVVEHEKVAELKKAIASGNYKIDPQKLAASIANFEFDLV